MRPAFGLLLVLLTLGAGSAPDTGVDVRLPGGTREHGSLLEIGGVRYVSAADVLRWYGATREWDPRLGKLTLHLKGHTLRFTVDTRGIQRDDQMLQAEAPAVYQRNMVWLPISVFHTTVPVGSEFRATWDPAGLLLGIGATGIALQSVAQLTAPDHDDLILTFSAPVLAERVRTERSAFMVRFHEAAPAPAGAGIHPSPLIQSAVLSRQGADVELQLTLPAQAVGYTLEHFSQPERWKLTVSRSVEALEAGRLTTFQMPGSRLALKASRVVLDPGHGGPDPGVVVGELRESDLTLALARQLKTELERGGSISVILTRDGDQDVPARRRAELANLEHGDLFISLHVDASPQPQDHGFEVLSWPLGSGPGEPISKITQKAMGATLERWDEVPARFSEASDSLAHNLTRSLEQVWTDGGRGARHRRLLPLEGVTMPSVMVECGVLTTGSDVERLQNAAGQAEIVAALADGIRRNLGAPPPPQRMGATP